MMTYEEAHKYFTYKDGILYWKEKPSPKARVTVGTKAGALTKQGYVRLQLNGKKYRAHRVIYLMHYGETPSVLDHMDSNKSNNKIENLRPATPSENGCNQKTRSDSKSGIKGVCWHERLNKWYTQIQLEGKKRYLGVYKDLQEAQSVVEDARVKLHGVYANNG